MSNRKRFGLWFAAGINHALAARAAFGELQSQNPGADWVLFGPRESLFLFEMDERVPVFIPLRALEPRRPAQTRLSYYLEKRAQFKKLRGLALDACFGVAELQHDPQEDLNIAKQFEHALGMLGTRGDLKQTDKNVFLTMPRPELQAGPQALAFATQLYRKVPPNQLKHLLLLGQLSGQDETIEAQWQYAQKLLQTDASMAPAMANLVTAVITKGDRLAARQLSQAYPDCLQVDLAQATGLIAYADRVICCSETITRICAEMGRSDRLLLGKSHS
jgi:hypothetical protein